MEKPVAAKIDEQQRDKIREEWKEERERERERERKREREGSVRAVRSRCVRLKTVAKIKYWYPTRKKRTKEVATAVPRTNCPIFLRCKRLCASNCVDSRSEATIYIALIVT